MEGLFQDGQSAIEYVGNTMRATFVGRAAHMVDRTVKTAFDTTYRMSFGDCLESRGYQLHGLNSPPCGVGLTRGQKEVRYCTYRPEAEPYLREARSIAAELLSSDQEWATGLVLGTGDCLVRVVIPEEISTMEHAESFSEADERQCAPCVATSLLGCVGGKDLLVFDMRVNEYTKATVKNIADKCFGTNRSPPAYYLTQATAAVAAMVAKSKAGKIGLNHRAYIKFDTADSEYQYLQSVKLLLLAEALNRAQNGQYTAVHCMDQGGIAGNDLEENGDLVWFPPNRTADGSANDKLERSIAALNRAQGTTVGLIPCLPATEFGGTAYEDMTVTMTDDQHEELLKQSLRAEDGTTQNAFYCGPNITGARPPLDTKHPETWASAYTRHFCRVSKHIPLPNGEVLDIVHDKAELQHKKLSGHQLRVWNDFIDIIRSCFVNGYRHHSIEQLLNAKENHTRLTRRHTTRSEVKWIGMYHLEHETFYVLQCSARAERTASAPASSRCRV
jgi:hypothetical protein